MTHGIRPDDTPGPLFRRGGAAGEGGVQGAGIWRPDTEIDVKATLKEKIDADVDPYIILGACNPELARRALEIEPLIGLLLPCNVVVRQAEGKVLVHALDPALMASIPNRPELQGVADDARIRVSKALETLSNR